jgi:hypothetical protein
MKQLALAGVVLALAVPAQVEAGPASEGDRVKAVLQTQARLLRQNRLRVMYETTYTATFRAHCPWTRYLRRQRYARSVLGPGFTVRNIRVRFLSPTKAILAYQYVRRDGVVAADVKFRDRDVYAKVGARWYDEWAHARDC